MRLYARIGQALLAAKRDGADPFAAIEKVVSWVDFARTVSEAEQLAQPEDFDFLGLISDGFPQMRRYTPAMLDIFEFRAAPAARPLLEVIDILRAMNRDKTRSVPQNAPLEWINQRWVYRSRLCALPSVGFSLRTPYPRSCRQAALCAR